MRLTPLIGVWIDEHLFYWKLQEAAPVLASGRLRKLLVHPHVNAQAPLINMTDFSKEPEKYLKHTPVEITYLGSCSVRFSSFGPVEEHSCG